MKKICVSQNRRKKVTLAKKSFTVPATGKVTLKIDLARKAFRIVKINHEIRARVTVTVDERRRTHQQVEQEDHAQGPEATPRRG